MANLLSGAHAFDQPLDFDVSSIGNMNHTFFDTPALSA
jgi:hypothetical protein